MHKLVIGLLLLILPGCVQIGPTPEEAKATYETEVQKLEEIDALIAKLQEGTIAALKQRVASEEMSEVMTAIDVAAFKDAEEEKQKIEDAQQELRQNLDKVTIQSDEHVKRLKNLRKEQQIRVAEAKRKWDAAK